MGLSVVNLEYRSGQVSLAPAAIEDCLCALHWIGRPPKDCHFDLDRVTVTGGSAGGHLALTTAISASSAGFENERAAEEDPHWSGSWPEVRPKISAVINWFGITDVC